jgi:Flp pilus assembly protein TadD
VLFLHNTSRVEGEPYPTLLKDKGFRGFPSLAFMTAEGEVIASPRQRSVVNFESTLAQVTSYVAFRAKMEAGDQSVARDLFIAELVLGKLEYEAAKARYESMEGFSEKQVSVAESHLRAMEAQLLLAKGQELLQARQYMEAADIYLKVTEMNPDHALAWYYLGYSLHSAGKLDEALVAHQKAAEMPGTARAQAMYNAACAYALKGDKEQALSWLSQAVNQGYRNANQMERDEDLKSLRDDPAYQEILAALRGR